MPIPLITAAIRAGSDQTNKRNQFESSLIGNAFNVLRGGGADQNLTGFLQNDSAKTLSQGLAGTLQNQEQAATQGAQQQGLGNLFSLLQGAV